MDASGAGDEEGGVRGPRGGAVGLYAGRGHANTPNLGLDGWSGWARLVDCHDGDTMTVVLLFRGAHFKVRIRVAGIDAPELRGPNATQALAARDALVKHLTGVDSRDLSAGQLRLTLDADTHLVWVTCGKPDKYGRTLCDVFSEQEAASCNAATALLGAGLARPYEGGKREPW